MVLGIVEGRDPGPARPLRDCLVTCGRFNPRGVKALGW
jgi:hypothetical protein